MLKAIAVLQLQEVWDDIRLLLRRHVLRRLSAHGPLKAAPGNVPAMSIPERLHCLQQLFFLYPQSEVLAHYQVRQKMEAWKHRSCLRRFLYQRFHSAASEIPVCVGPALGLVYQPRL